MTKAIGLIEAEHIPVIAAADAAAKAADVRIIDIENSTFSGMLVLKIEGDVSAVEAAIAAGAAEAEPIGRVYRKVVIPHPAEDMAQMMVYPGDKKMVKVTETSVPVEITEANDDLPVQAEIQICNICLDPKCPRRKGQPHKMCRNYSK